MTEGYELDQAALDALFINARTFNGWKEKDVSVDLLRKIYDTMKWGPTSVNCCPMRVVFVRSQEEKEKLKPMLDKGNQEKTMEAPVVALFAHTRKFFEKMDKLAPHVDVEKWYGGKPELVAETAWRNGTLQTAYFMLAARACGLDCGPMSGFSKDKVKEAFFPDLDGDVNYICALGYGRPETLYPRAQRLAFEEVCEIV